MVIYVALGLSYVRHFVWLVSGCIVCLVVGILYVQSVASGTTVSLRSPSRALRARVRALRARCGPFGPAGGAPINNALGGGGSPIALVHFRCVMNGSYFVLCVDFCLPSRRIFVCLVVGCLSV